MKIQNRELHRIASTAIIYNKDKKYLLVKRSLDKKDFPGRWSVPGGGLEVDDYIDLPKNNEKLWYFAIEKSLRREVREEVNLEVGKVKYLLDMAFIRSDGIPAIILSFYCAYKSGEVKLNKENTDCVWATYKEAKNYDLIGGLLGEIEMVDKILEGDNTDKIEHNDLE